MTPPPPRFPVQPQGQPQGGAPSTSGTDGTGTTINYLATTAGLNLTPRQIYSLAGNLRINPNTNLSPDQVATVKQALSEMPRPFKTSQDTPAEDGPASAADSASNGPSGVGAMAQNGPGGGSGPFMAGGASGSPAPSGSAQPPQQPTAGGGNAPGLRPSPVGTQEEARLAFTSAQNKEAAAAYLSARKPEQAKVFLEQAKADRERGEKILGSLGEYNKPTTEQQNAEASGARSPMEFEARKKAQDQELTRGDALQKGLQGASREFETALKPHLDAMRGILNNPNFVSGSGVGFQEALNKIRSNPLFQGLPGYDPNAALPNEAIRKVVAASILNQTTELKAEAAEMGGSAGRLFQQQISLMEKAAQNPENTAPALRYLTELQQRMGDHARAVAELASNYQGKYGKGVLDNGFNEELSKFNNSPKNQIFTPSEIRDMRTFAPPVAPLMHDKAEATAWADKAGIRPGDPIKTPAGRVVPYDPSKFK
jgi:hypothetical protein